MENIVFLFDTANGGKCLTTKLLQRDDFITTPFTPLSLRAGCNKKAFVDAIRAAFETGKVCGDSIQPRFFNDAVKKNTVLIAVAEVGATTAAEINRGGSLIDLAPLLRDTLRGFVLARPQPDASGKDLYIDLICASAPKGNPGLNGKALMAFVSRYARFRGFEEVTLSAIAPVLTYYPRLGLGFKFRKSCNGTPVPASDDFLCSKMTGKNPFAPENKKTADFMLQLNQAGVEHSHDPKDHPGGVCGRKGLDMETFRAHRCHTDGYILKKCFKEDGRRQSARVDCPKAPAEHGWSLVPNYLKGFLSSLIGK